MILLEVTCNLVSKNKNPAQTEIISGFTDIFILFSEQNSVILNSVNIRYNIEYCHLKNEITEKLHVNAHYRLI